MYRSRILAAHAAILIAAVIVMATACGRQAESGTGATTSAGATTTAAPQVNGTELAFPVAITGPQPGIVVDTSIDSIMPPAPRGASMLEEVLTSLRRKTLLMAGVRAEITAACAGNRITLAAGATTDCTTTYGGRSIPWSVTINSVYHPGDTLVGYSARPLAVLVTPQNVYQQFWVTYGVRNDKLSCELIPGILVVEPATRTPYRCQLFDRPDKIFPAGGWVQFAVKVSDTAKITFG